MKEENSNAVVISEKKNSALITTSEKEERINNALTTFKGGSREGKITSIDLEDRENKFSKTVEDMMEKEAVLGKKDANISENRKINMIVGNQRLSDISKYKTIKGGSLLVANEITDKYELLYRMRAVLEKYVKNKLLFKINTTITPIINMMDNSKYIDIVLPFSDLLGVVHASKHSNSRLSNSYIGAYVVNCKAVTHNKYTIISGRQFQNLFDDKSGTIESKNILDNKIVKSIPMPEVSTVRYLKRTDFSPLYDDLLNIIITKATIDIWEIYPYLFESFADNLLETFSTNIALNTETEKEEKAEEIKDALLLTREEVLIDDEISKREKEEKDKPDTYINMLKDAKEDLAKELVDIKIDMFDIIVNREKDMTIINPMMFYPLENYLDYNTVNLMLDYFNTYVLGNDDCYSEFFKLFNNNLADLYDEYIIHLSSIEHEAHKKYKILHDRWIRVVPSIALRVLFNNCYMYCNELIDKDIPNEEIPVD